jgi:hypothetical protein
VRAIHNQLRADVSHHPEQKDQLVCRAFQQCYDICWEFYQQGGVAYHVIEAPLGEKVFQIARECKWLPTSASMDNPEWREWVKELIADRCKWEGFEDCSLPTPFLSVPFPKEINGAEASKTRHLAKESVESQTARKAFVMPILHKKGWCVLEWATESNVDFHTANDYLKGRTHIPPLGRNWPTVLDSNSDNCQHSRESRTLRDCPSKTPLTIPVTITYSECTPTWGKDSE